jgi:hypothetical protein
VVHAEKAAVEGQVPGSDDRREGFKKAKMSVLYI